MKKLTCNNLDRILFVVVSCSREKNRADSFKKTIQALNKQHQKIPFKNNLLFYDNDSVVKTPFESLKIPATIAYSSKNIGYWSALQWVLENYNDTMNQEFDFIHPIESDLILYNLEALNEAVSFLDITPEVMTVRTQEFNVNKKEKYFKNRKSLFKAYRSLVADYNGVTQEKVRFSQHDIFENIFISNWHAKVPALHRLQYFKDIFNVLSKSGEVNEHMFMKECHNICENVAVLNNGIYYDNLAFNALTHFLKIQPNVSGSLSSADKLNKIGYRHTRTDVFDHEYPKIKIEKIGK